MQLQKLHHDFSICKISTLAGVDMSGEYTFVAKTDDELSLLCETQRLPEQVTVAEHGWKGLKICGVLDFDLVGIIAGISGLLSQEGIPVFVVSTYNTDYIFTKDAHYDEALRVLAAEGHEVV